MLKKKTKNRRRFCARRRSSPFGRKIAFSKNRWKLVRMAKLSSFTKARRRPMPRRGSTTWLRAPSRTSFRVSNQGGDRRIRHRRLQRKMPRVGVGQRRRLAKTYRTHRFLDGSRQSLCYLRAFLYGNAMVDYRRVVEKGAFVPRF